MNYAPIAIFCYRKIDTLKITVQSLINNKESLNSVCYFFSDGYKNDNDKNDVEKVRTYIQGVRGFKKIIIVEAESNKGLAKSIIEGVTKVVNDYGKIIVVEDDLEVSPFFLEYMNSALSLYENDANVGCISGYVYPIKTKKSTFFIKGADCWGWATWKRAWSCFNSDGKLLLNSLKQKKLCYEFNFNDSFPYVKMLEDQINGLNNSWAIRFYASFFLKEMLCLYPGHTLVKNIGFGVDGAVHCKNDIGDIFNSDLALYPINLEKIDLVEASADRRLFITYFKNSFSPAWELFLSKYRCSFLIPFGRFIKMIVYKCHLKK